MSSILVINAAGRETRVALVENGHIAEFYLERKKDKGVVGNIYKGRVVRVLPGMQAAFVDIGLEKAAFLYVSDVVYDPDFARAQFELTEGEHDEAPEVPELVEGGEEPAPSSGGDFEFEVQELAPGQLAPPPGARRTVTGELPAVASGPTGSEARAVTGEHPAVETPRAVTGEQPAVAAEQPAAPQAAADRAPPLRTGEEAAPSPGEVVNGEMTMAALGEATEAAPAMQALPIADANGAAAAEAPTPEGSATAEAAPPAALELAAVPPGTAEGGEPAEAKASASEGSADVRGERRAPKEQRNREKQQRRNREERDRKPHHRDEEKAKPRKEARIEDLLKVGQEILVQISKDPIGTKGARLTSHISIPGRHLVFMPTVDHVGISRRIGNEKERRRLRDIVDRLRPPGTGFIVRTVAESVPQEKLEADIRFLIEVWNETVRKNEKRGGPGLMHPDLDLILRATRDLFAHDVEKLVVDDREEYERISSFVAAQDPALRDRVILHESEEPVFDAYGIEHELKRAVQRKVWLKSGGYLIIDQAEALTAIDVNSGRYVGKKSLEETITKINMEAAKEIVYQLRLRNIGGIIICDFIDMEKTQNRDKVFKALQEALGRDKAKTNVLRISELGLVEMTRKRVRESIGRVLHEDCAYCDGQGYVKTATTVCYEIFREIRREAPGYKDPLLVINCHGDVARLLQGEERLELRHLMDRYNKSIQVKAQQNYHREQYDVYGRSATGADHQVAASTGPVGPSEGYGAPKQRPLEPDRPGGGRERERRRERRNERRDRGGGGDKQRGEGGQKAHGGGGRDGQRRDREERGREQRERGRPDQASPATSGGEKAGGLPAAEAPAAAAVAAPEKSEP